MFKVLIFCLYLVYFWYFYHSYSKPVTRPSTAAPLPPEKLDVHFNPKSHTMFQFMSDGKNVWEHAFHDDLYLVQKQSNKIIERDDCYYYPQHTLISARGLGLYKYLKNHPEFNKDIAFQENSPYTTQQGDVFYFTCSNRRIEALDMCPSGQVFQNATCIDVTSCTGKPNLTKLPYHPDHTKYIECKNGREFIKQCPTDTFFYHDECVPKYNLIHKCIFSGDTTAPMKLDDKTLFECRNHKPVYTTCLPGTQLFENTFCEPDNCVGQLNGTKLNLRKRTVGPFTFVPGYMECFKEKVFQTIECPSTWDPMMTDGDNLTHLPMVFDGQKCTVPSFCQNVLSDDPDVWVPIHEFTKHVQNWQNAQYYDQTVGFTCTPTGRKRKQLDPGQRIGKHFKIESACDNPNLIYLPIYDQPTQYYDCIAHRVVTCPAMHFFNGSVCQMDPGPQTFQFNNLPLFQFNGLNDEAWITPWDYLPKTITPLRGCHSADFTYLRLYNICTHADCMNYAFLSMVSDLSILLPVGQKAKCKFDAQDRHLKKEPVDLNYTFWNQKVLPMDVNSKDECVVGQKLQTGHFVWDTTIFATCDLTQPFIFCPSPHTQGLVKSHQQYACAPPPDNKFLHTRTSTWTAFATNEIKRILPPVWDTNPYKFNMNKGDRTLYEVPETGYEIPHNSRFNLRVNRPVHLELQYRVTHPPNIAFKYDSQNTLQILEEDGVKGFMVRYEKFSDSSLFFPSYTPHGHVNQFLVEYHP